MADESVGFKVNLDTDEATRNAKRFQDTTDGMFHGVTEGAAEGGAKLLEFGVELAGLVGIATTVHGALESIFEGIKGADEIRDLHASLEALTGSEQGGVQAFRNLEIAAEGTRVTGVELAKLYGETLPLAIDKGFSVEAAQRFVAQIAKAAPAIGMSVEQAIGQAEQILSGRVRKTNLLAHVLGLDPAAYTAGLQQLDSVFPKLDELADKGEKIGQTFESAGKKIKDGIVVAFAEGFNDARGKADGVNSVLDDLVKKIKDPELVGAVHELGKAIADIAPFVISLGTSFANFLASLVEGASVIRKTFALDKGPQERRDKTWDNIYAAVAGESKIGPDDEEVRRQERNLNDLKKIQEYQRTFGHGAAPFKGGSGPIPDVMQFVAGEAVVEKFNTTLADTGIKTKSVKDAMAGLDVTLHGSEASFDEAKLAFNKLFARPQTDPLLKALQEADEQAAALTGKLLKMQQTLLDAAAKKENAPIAGQLKGIASDFGDLASSVAAANEAKKAFMEDDALRKMLDATDKAIKTTDASFAELAQSIGRQFAGEGIQSAMVEGVKAITAQTDAEIHKLNDSIFIVTPEKIAELKKSGEDAAKNWVEGVKSELSLAKTAFEEQVSSIFGNARPGLFGLGTTDFSQLSTQLAGAGDALAKVIQKATGASWEDAVKQAGPELRKQLLDAFQKGADQLRSALDAIGQNLADLLTSGLTGGARGFAASASALFAKNLSTSVGDILKNLTFAAFGGVQQAGPGASPAEIAAVTAANQKTTAVATGTLQLIGLFSQISAATTGINNPRQQPVGTVIGTTLTGLSAGATIGGATAIGGTYGGIIGAIVGLIIGGLMLALAPAVGKAYPYAKDISYKPYGTSTFTPTQNITNDEAAASLAKLVQQGDTFTNAYAKLMIDLGIKGLDKIMKGMGNITAITGLDKPGGSIGGAANKDFWQQFDNWVQVGMPKQFETKFFAPIQGGFQALGVSAGKFQQVWDHLMQLDPKQAIATLDTWANALTEIQKATQYFAKDSGRLMRQAYGDVNKSFVQTLAESDQSIMEFGDSIKNLVGEDQINAMKQLGDLETQRMQQVQEFLKGLAQAIDQVSKSYDAAIRGLTLEGIKGPGGKPDIQGQVDFLKQYANQLLGDIKTAQTPQEVLQASEDLKNVLMQIKQLGGSTSPEADEAFRKWAIENLQIGKQAATDQLKKFADQVAEQNRIFLEGAQKIVDALNDAANLIATSLGHQPLGPHTEGPPSPPTPGDSPYIPRGRGGFRTNNDVPTGGWGDPWWDQPWKGGGAIPDWNIHFRLPWQNTPTVPPGGRGGGDTTNQGTYPPSGGRGGGSGVYASAENLFGPSVNQLADTITQQTNNNDKLSAAFDAFKATLAAGIKVDVKNTLVVQNEEGDQVTYTDTFAENTVRGRYAS